MKTTLIIDNFDSFTFNLVQYVGELKGNPCVFRNDKITLQKAQELSPTHIIISPGPGHPGDQKYFGICGTIIQEMGRKIPLLGVCLGHQGIVLAFGGRIRNAPSIMHGKSCEIFHEGDGIFKNIPTPMEGMRYHSLITDRESFPSCLRVTAKTKSGDIMALRHREYSIYGIQFHPESIGTPAGKQILKNFLHF